MENQVTILLASFIFLVVFVVMHQINRNLFKSILVTPLAHQFIKVDEYETSNKKLSYALFYLLAFLSIALTINFYDLKINFFRIENYVPLKDNDFQFIYWSIIIGGFFLLKSLIEYIAFYILDLKQAVQSFIKYKLLLANYCLVLFVPVIFFNAFNDYHVAIKFKDLLVVLLFIYIIGQVIYISKYNKRFINHLHYIILYLCAFEFGMYFIIYQMIIN